MEMDSYFKAVLDQDPSPVVLCNLNHIILYMNQAAISRYARQGGEALIGKSLLCCHSEKSADVIRRVLAAFSESTERNIFYEFRNDEENKDVYMVALRDENGVLIGYYEKHDYRDREKARVGDFVG